MNAAGRTIERARLATARRSGLSAPAALVAALALLGACAAPERSEGGDGHDAGAATGADAASLAILSSSPLQAGDALTRTDLFDGRSREERWAVVEGDGAGTALTRVVRSDSASGDRWTERLGDETTFHLRLDADGGVSMVETVSHADAAVSLFDPALPMAPALLAAESPLRGSVRMAVVEEARRDRTTQTGRATRTLTLRDRARIATPLGSFDALRATVEFRADLPLARAVEEAVLFVVPGTGVVAEQRTKRLTVLGFAARTRAFTMVRLRER